MKNVKSLGNILSDNGYDTIKYSYDIKNKKLSKK